MHPLEAVRVRGRRGTLDGGGQVEDDLAARSGLVDVHHRLADLQREVQLGVGEDLRAVLVAELGLGAQQLLRVLHHQAGAVDGDLLDVVLGAAEDDPAEDRRGRVVQVDGGPLGALQRLHGPLDQVLAGLGQYGDRDVVRDRALFLDDRAHEVVVGLAGGREADLDLLVAHLHQQVEHRALARGRHGVDQGLVAVAQVGGEPAGGGGDARFRPGAVGDVDLVVAAVLVDRHGAGLLAVCHGGVGSSKCPRVSGSGRDGRRRNAELRGEGVGLDYRPSPRQLRRSSPIRMMLRMLAEPVRWAGPRISMRDRGPGTRARRCRGPGRSATGPTVADRVGSAQRTHSSQNPVLAFQRHWNSW